jgi:Zn finger protein HypA/HybF involved in hydrogenase expression
VTLSLDEYEAFKLTDHMGLSHVEAAEEMEISRSTFSRLVERARKKIAGLVIEGKLLTIEGGNIHFRKNMIRCHDCGHMFITNMGDAAQECPSCGSGNLINLAGGFGHGRCCEGGYRKKGDPDAGQKQRNR